MTQASCHRDPARAMVPVLERLAASGVPLGDVPGDSGYAHRVPRTGPCRCAPQAPKLIQDLHPDDRGPHGTHAGAVISNGNLYCPATPRPLPGLGPLARDATPGQTAAHDRQADRRDRPLQARQNHQRRRRRPPHRHVPRRDGQAPLPATAAVDVPGLPAAPHTILAPPQHPPACCTQQSITVPPEVHAKTAQKHDYPSKSTPVLLRPALRCRADLLHSQGPCQQRHQPRLVPPDGTDPDHHLFACCLLIVRNQRILDAFDARCPPTFTVSM